MCLSLGTTPMLGPPAAAERGYRYSLQACSLSLQGWGLIDLLLRASDEHILIVRVPRAREIIRPHPYLLASGGGQFISVCLPQ